MDDLVSKSIRELNELGCNVELLLLNHEESLTASQKMTLKDMRTDLWDMLKDFNNSFVPRR